MYKKYLLALLLSGLSFSIAPLSQAQTCNVWNYMIDENGNCIDLSNLGRSSTNSSIQSPRDNSSDRGTATLPTPATAVPLTQNEQQSLVDLYNLTYCQVATQAELFARSNRTIITESNKESIQREWARLTTVAKTFSLPKNKRKDRLFEQEVQPYIYQSLSQCPK